jgi:hypothetical protein
MHSSEGMPYGMGAAACILHGQLQLFGAQQQHTCHAQRFRPMTVERPKVLLPLVNVPMINYTLEWLLASGVDEVRRSWDIQRLALSALVTSAVEVAVQSASPAGSSGWPLQPWACHRHASIAAFVGEFRGIITGSGLVLCRSWCSAARTRRRCSGT